MERNALLRHGVAAERPRPLRRGAETDDLGRALARGAASHAPRCRRQGAGAERRRRRHRRRRGLRRREPARRRVRIPGTAAGNRGHRRHALQPQLQRSAQPGAARRPAPPSWSATRSTAARRASSCRAACSRCRCGVCGRATPSSTSRSPKTSAAAISAAARRKRTIPPTCSGCGPTSISRAGSNSTCFCAASASCRTRACLRYTELNGRVGWRATPHFEVSVVGAGPAARPPSGIRRARAAARRVRAQRPRPGGVQVLMRRFLVALLLCACTAWTSAQDVGARVPRQGRVPVQLHEVRRMARHGAVQNTECVHHLRGGTESVRPDPVGDARGRDGRRPARCIARVVSAERRLVLPGPVRAARRGGRGLPAGDRRRAGADGRRVSRLPRRRAARSTSCSKAAACASRSTRRRPNAPSSGSARACSSSGAANDAQGDE